MCRFLSFSVHHSRNGDALLASKRYDAAMTIGPKLKTLRTQKNLSLRILGNEVGIPYNTLSAYERNAIQPTLENCYKMAMFFEVPMEYFVHGEDTKQEFADGELLALFHQTDKLKTEDRAVIKGYIEKYLRARRELDELKAESE